MPTNSALYETYPEAEQQSMSAMLSRALRVPEESIKFDNYGQVLVTMPTGIDQLEIANQINGYAERMGLTDGELPKEIAGIDRSGHVTLDMAEIRSFAGINQQDQLGIAGEGYTYGNNGDIYDALQSGGQLIYDAEKARNPEIPPNRIAENLEATLGGMQVIPELGGNYAINVDATPDAIDRITDIIDSVRETAGLSNVSVGTEKDNGQLIISGTSADMNALNTALLESGKVQEITLIAAAAPMQYDRQAGRGGGVIDPETLEKIKDMSGDRPLGVAPVDLTAQQIANLKKQASDSQVVLDDAAIQALDDHAAKGYVVTENTKTQKTNIAVEAIAKSLGVAITKDGDLSKEEIQDLQEKVGAKKNSRGEFDGIIGPDTLAQIKKAMSGKVSGAADVEGVGAPGTAVSATKIASASPDMA